MSAETSRLRLAVFHVLLALARCDLHGPGIADAIDEATDGTVRPGSRGLRVCHLLPRRDPGRIRDSSSADLEALFSFMRDRWIARRQRGRPATPSATGDPVARDRRRPIAARWVRR